MMDLKQAAEIAYGHLPRWKEQKVVDALRKARKYIRTVESWSKTDRSYFDRIIDSCTDGDEIKAIEDALAEMGIIV